MFGKTDFDGYATVAEFEICLRRVVRWELMSTFGRAWFSEVSHSEIVEQRIAKERRHGFLRDGSSLLSYLSLGELQDIIFNDFWIKSFKNVFQGNKSLQKDLLNKILPVRNKLAHFRPINASEINNLQLTNDFFSILRNSYGKPELTEFYLSGESERANELMDEELILEAKNFLESYDLNEIWNAYLSIEWLRAYGVFPGL
jgi:hypothetical protein